MKKCITELGLSVLLLLISANGLNAAVEKSSFLTSQIPANHVIPASEGYWNHCMAPIYDEQGKVHVFVSIIPNNGSWAKHSKIGHYTADDPKGPYTFQGITFESAEATYHNPQISKIGDTYVLVFLKNHHLERNRQEVGLATAKSLEGPWRESPLNPVIPAAGMMGGAEIVHASNPTLVVTPEGKYRIYYKSMTNKNGAEKPYREISFAESDKLEGPYVNFPGNPVISYASSKVDLEDPYIFRYQGAYFMIVEDRTGVVNLLSGSPIPAEKIRPGGFRPGIIYTSQDGIDWGKPKVAYETNETYFGAKLGRSERPHILWKDGKPEYLFLACLGDDDPTAGFVIDISNWDGKF
ncbi:MAG: hypothetical protein SynsKO_06480 [Synoicihabitans sp.]